MEELFEPFCSNHRQLRQQMHSVTAVGSKSTLLKSRTTLWYSSTTATHTQAHTNTGQTWQSAEHRTPLQPKIPAGFQFVILRFCVPLSRVASRDSLASRATPVGPLGSSRNLGWKHSAAFGLARLQIPELEPTSCFDHRRCCIYAATS